MVELQDSRTVMLSLAVSGKHFRTESLIVAVVLGTYFQIERLFVIVVLGERFRIGV